MKVIIWVHQNDVMANKILTYHFTRPIIDRHDDYVQVSIDVDEFVLLQDKGKEAYKQSSGRSEQNYTYCNEWPNKELI